MPFPRTSGAPTLARPEKGTMRRQLTALASCALASLPAQERDGAIAPAHTWYTFGGCASRSGRAETRPVLTAPTAAWRFKLGEGAQLEGEALVWQNLVLVSSKEKEERVLHCLDLRDGRSICRPLRFASSLPLGPSLWRNRVVLRSGPNSIRLVQLSRPVAKTLMSWDFKAPVSAPLMYRDELYVNAGGELLRLAPDKQDPVWRAGRALRGNPSLKGPLVYVLGGSGKTSVQTFRRSSGKRGRSVGSGSAKGASPADGSHVFLGNNQMLAWLSASETVLTSNGRQRINAFAPGTGGFFGSNDTPLHLHAPPCMTDAGWMVLDGVQTKGKAWIRRRYNTRRRAWGLQVLAERGLHDALLQAKGASQAGNVLLLHNLAFESGSGQVLWRHKLTPRNRPIPVRGGLLISDQPGQLCLLRSGAAADEWEAALRRGAARPAPPSGPMWATVVMRDDVTRASKLRFDTAKKLFKQGSREFPTEDLALIFDKDKKLLFWADNPDLAATGLANMIEAAVDKAFFKLAKSSIHTNHKPTIQHYLDGLIARGAPKLEINRLKGRLRSNSAFKRAPKMRRVAQLREEEKELYKKALTGNWRDFESVAETVPLPHVLACASVMLQHDPQLLERIYPLLRRFDKGLAIDQRLALFRHLLDVAPDQLPRLWKDLEPHLKSMELERKLTLAHWVLDIDPKHEGITKMVRGLNPLNVPGAAKAGPEEISAHDWLELIENSRGLNLKLVELPKDLNNFDPTPEIRELAKQTRTWRKDLIAVQSDRVILFTPLANPGRIARCLSMGELLCDTLEEMFAYSETKRSKALRIKIILYSSQQEYLEKSIERGAGHSIVWTAGHYSPFERCAYMFLPEDEGAFNSVLDVFAHELTHYWIDVQCPLFDFYNRQLMITMPGYWIVEGFAGMVESFQFDLRSRKVGTVKPANRDLDIVASARASLLLPWDALFKIHHLGMQRGLRKAPGPNSMVETRWNLGAYPMQSQTGMFYAQSAAACHYLYHAEDGKYRRKLLEFVGKYYRGERKEVDFEKHFGVSPRVLGPKIVAYAKKVTGSD